MTASRHRRQQPERVLQTALVEHLRLRGRDGVLWLHVPNGGSRDIREAANLQRMGALAGASDLLLFRPGACPHCGRARLEGFALQLKSDGGRLSDAQLEFLARFNDAGGHSAVAESIDRALACMEAWGLLSGRSQ
jgi:VRR-NUC domain